MKKQMLALVCGSLLLTSACYTIQHTVGTGGRGGSESEKRQWYALFGLIPLGEVDSKSLAGDAANYTVTTQWGIVDILLNLITGIVTITSQTVTVER